MTNKDLKDAIISCRKFMQEKAEYLDRYAEHCMAENNISGYRVNKSMYQYCMGKIEAYNTILGMMESGCYDE